MIAPRTLSLARRAGLAIAAAGALAASSAQGQGVKNSDQPIDITANALELIDAQRVEVWTGAVEAVQGTNRLRTNLLRVYHAPKRGGENRVGQWGEPQRLVAEGDVYFLTPESAARGAVAVYDLSRDTVTMTGDVVLTRGESVLRGDKLVINTATGLATMDANAQGRGAKRVRGVFYPEERAAASPPARPRATAPATTSRPSAPAAAAPRTAASTTSNAAASPVRPAGTGVTPPARDR